MQPYQYNGQQGALTLQQKSGWQQGQTNAVLYFVHGSTILPSTVHTSSLSPAHGTEYLVDDNNAPIAGGKLLFSFRVCAGNGLPANADKPAGVGRLWGLNGHCYVFRVPAQTTYWSQNGTLGHGQEIAWPYVIESADIVEYWAPSDNYRSEIGAIPNARRRFQKVSWNSFLTARTNSLNAI